METIERRHSIIFLLALAAFCGCVTTSPLAPRPDWILHSKSDDTLCMYRVGHASGQADEIIARKLAFDDALAQFSQSILSSVKVSGLDTHVTSAFDIKGAEIVQGGLYSEKDRGAYECWVEVGYPLEEKQKIVDRLQLGEQLNSFWASAKTDFNKSNYESARRQLQRIISGYEKALYLSFSLPEAQLCMADSCAELKDFLQARQWYDNLIKSAGSPWRERASERLNSLPAPPKSWPLHDRFGGGRVALVCGKREGGAWLRDEELSAVLASELRDARLESVDVTSRLSGENFADLPRNRQIDPAIAVANHASASVVLAVYLDIDPQKRGKMERVMDVETQAIDTKVSFFVISTGSRSLAFDGCFKEVAGANTDAALARHAATILIQNYLAPKCPPVK